MKLIDERFRVYIDRLRGGEEKISEELEPTFLEVAEKDLSFPYPVKIQGVVELAEEEVILRLSFETKVSQPCTICNEKTLTVIQDAFDHAEPLADCKDGIFNFKELLREAVLLSCPAYAECEGDCPKRAELKGYLKGDAHLKMEGLQRPFSEL